MANLGGHTLHEQIDRLFQDGTVSGLTDADLLDRYLTRRDEAAFEALVRLHGPMVLGLCRRLLRDRQEVEDAFQATFLILVRKAPSLRDRKLLANWLYGVAYRVAARARKKSARRNLGRQPSEQLDELASDRAESTDSADWIPILDQELTRLPEKFRGPLVLCYLNGRTHEQSAGQLGIPVGTVRSRLARGRDLLKRRLERRGVAPGVIAAAIESPSRFLANVPAPLVRSTLALVKQYPTWSWITAVLGTGVTTTSALSLAQGVMTSMVFNQAKLLGIGLLATAVVGVGVAQGVRAVGTQPGEQDTSQEPRRKAVDNVAPRPPMPKDVAKASGKQSEPPPDDPTGFSGLNPDDPVEKPILELKRQLDQLRTQIQSKPQPPKADEPPRRVSEMLDLTRFKPQVGMSLPELEAEARILKRRIDSDRQVVKLTQVEQQRDINNDFTKFIAANQRLNETQDSIQRLIAKLQRIQQDIAEEEEALRYGLLRKDAERRVEGANTSVALTKVARNERLNARLPGAVSDEDKSKDEHEFKFAKAQEDVVVADIEFLKSRLKYLDFPKKKVSELLNQARAIDLSDPASTRSPTAPKLD